MGETLYPSFFIYLVEELCSSLKTLQTILMEDNSYQILTIGDWCESRLFASFSNRISIESGSDVNLLGSDN
ncbi:hypothetical protein BHM03_00062399 [Ensete ventricosum]|nr:hypothetical protein BHM03_00062399 [Ensete ventricosum]